MKMQYPLAAIFLWVVMIATAIAGWVINIVKLIGMSIDTITIELILRFIGIFIVPLGSIMGLFF